MALNPEVEEAARTAIIESRMANLSINIVPIRQDAEEEDDIGCSTPKGEEHKIPVPLTCPPAPKKPSPPSFSDIDNNHVSHKSMAVAVPNQEFTAKLESTRSG